MSRVGRKPVSIPAGIKVEIRDGALHAEGPKGKISQRLVDGVDVEIAEGTIRVARRDDSGPQRSLHGLMRALLQNAVTGVSQGFSKRLEIHGVGYRAEVKGREVHFALGYSHPVVYDIPEQISIEVDKQNRIDVSGPDRQLVGQVAAEIRSLRAPEPYKGKGIRYSDETLRRKVGKAGAR